MTSTKPVNVYVVICSGTIDRKLESLIQDKGDAAELVLDGRLIGERTEEVNLAELLKTARREFLDDKTQTIDEAELQKQWTSTLKPQLQQAMLNWDTSCGVPVATALQSVGRIRPIRPMAASLGAFTILKQRVQTAAPKPQIVNPKSETVNPSWRSRMTERAKKLAAQSKPDVSVFHNP